MEMKVTDEILYVGVNDHEVDLFEGQYVVENGMAYNSYVILDEKIAVMDSVDARFAKQWLSNLEAALAGKKPDYLVVQHMEPDHSGSVAAFMECYPEARIVASAKAFVMMKQFFGKDFADRQIAVSEGSVLELGRHTLAFFTAPMVHWPEVIVTYDRCDRVLFSADAFGKFGALDVQEDWACEARRYYFGIVGKYGQPVQALLKKAAALDIAQICPLHGPVLRENLGYYLGLYQTWSSYQAETEGVFIACASAYGHTREAAEQLAEQLRGSGCKVSLADLARCDMAEAVGDAFRYSKLVLACMTYNGGIFPVMREFIQAIAERGYQKRTVALIENGSWAPTAAKAMRQMLEGCKELSFAEPVVSIRSAMDEKSCSQLNALSEFLSKGE